MSPPAKRWGESPHLIQGVFIAAFVLGTGGILALKTLGAPQLVVTALPLVIMVAYAALVFIPPFRLRPDQTGDNLYYLGFLFTLVSLGYSLHQFTVTAGVDEIVQNFGIAIASTIGGVFGRVLLNQMRTDPWEVERAARLALADSAKALRNELDNSVIEFNAYRRQIQQAAADGIHELQVIATKQLEGSSARLERMVQETSGRVEAVVGHWTDSAEGFNRRSREMAQAMEQLSGRLEAVRAPAEIINEKMAPASEAVTRLAEAAEGAAANIQGAIGRIESGAAELKNIVEGSREIVELARTQSGVLTQAGAILDAARRQVEQMDEAGQRFEAGLSRTSDELGQGLLGFLDRLDEQLALARRLAAEGQAAFAETAARDIGRMAGQLDELIRAQRQPQLDIAAAAPEGALVTGAFGEPAR